MGAAAPLALAAALLVSCGAQGAAPNHVLLSDAGTGNASDTLTSSSNRGWDLDWTFDCTRTGGTGVFFVDVLLSDRSPDFKNPGVSEQGDRGSGVYHVPGSGRFYLAITTTCSWSVTASQR